MYPNGMEKGGSVHEYPAWCHLPAANLTSAAGVGPGDAVLYWAHASSCCVPEGMGQSACLDARMGESGGGGDGGGARGDGGVRASGSQAPRSPQAPAQEAHPVPLRAPPW